MKTHHSFTKCEPIQSSYWLTSVVVIQVVCGCNIQCYYCASREHTCIKGSLDLSKESIQWTWRQTVLLSFPQCIVPESALPPLAHSRHLPVRSKTEHGTLGEPFNKLICARTLWGQCLLWTRWTKKRFVDASILTIKKPPYLQIELLLWTRRSRRRMEHAHTRALADELWPHYDGSVFKSSK